MFGWRLQVGYKHMLYMSMHAEAVVDLVETEHKEVQFRQVQGDFSMLQGKFMLQEGSPEVSSAAAVFTSQVCHASRCWSIPSGVYTACLSSFRKQSCIMSLKHT